MSDRVDPRRVIIDARASAAEAYRLAVRRSAPDSSERTLRARRQGFDPVTTVAYYPRSEGAGAVTSRPGYLVGLSHTNLRDGFWDGAEIAFGTATDPASSIRVSDSRGGNPQTPLPGTLVRISSPDFRDGETGFIFFREGLPELEYYLPPSRHGPARHGYSYRIDAGSEAANTSLRVGLGSSVGVPGGLGSIGWQIDGAEGPLSRSKFLLRRALDFHPDNRNPDLEALVGHRVKGETGLAMAVEPEFWRPSFDVSTPGTSEYHPAIQAAGRSLDAAFLLAEARLAPDSQEDTYEQRTLGLEPVSHGLVFNHVDGELDPRDRGTPAHLLGLPHTDLLSALWRGAEVVLAVATYPGNIYKVYPWGVGDPRAPTDGFRIVIESPDFAERDRAWIQYAPEEGPAVQYYLPATWWGPMRRGWAYPDGSTDSAASAFNVGLIGSADVAAGLGRVAHKLSDGVDRDHPLLSRSLRLYPEQEGRPPELEAQLGRPDQSPTARFVTNEPQDWF